MLRGLAAMALTPPPAKVIFEVEVNSSGLSSVPASRQAS